MKLALVILALTFCLPSSEAYSSTCTGGRCGERYNRNNGPCHCNDNCSKYRNCCNDYESVCLGTGAEGSATSGNTIADLSERLIALDMENNNMMSYVTLDYQSRISSRGCGYPDGASRKLFSRVDESKVMSIPTVAALTKLYDNYNADVTSDEPRPSSEIREEKSFISAVVDTAVMTETYNWLKTNGFFTGSKAKFADKLHEIWFTPYDRDGNWRNGLGSSGFEHVFLGEIKNREVSGFHSWIYYYLEEKAGRIDYRGYSWKVSFPGNVAAGVTNALTWAPENGSSYPKCIGGFFVGISPELDLATMSLCFLARNKEKCQLSFKGKKFEIVTHNYTYNGKTLVGSAYPKF